MTNEKIVTLQVRFTRARAFMAMLLFFLCWHPRVLDSETLQLTTYYPAPYGGYVSILTTGNTYLARDTGNVGVGTLNFTPRRKLDVNGEVVAVNRMTLAQNMDNASLTWHLDNSGGRFRVFDQPNINTNGTERVTILSGSGNVGINSSFPTTRLDVNGAATVRGDLVVQGGWLQGLCTEVAFGGGTTWCPGGRRVMAQYGTGRCFVGNLFLGGSMEQGGRWVPHYEQGCSGTMLCCYVRNF